MNRRIYIDLGAYNGDTIDLAHDHIPGIDEVYAFEPLSRPCAEMVERFRDRGYHIHHAAADVTDGQSRVYLGQAHGDISSSLHDDNPNCDTEKYEDILTIDFPKFLSAEFGSRESDDEIILKMNIEGSEYSILERMINDGSIGLVKTIFCDWHWYYVGISEAEHHNLVKRLRRFGHNLCGDKPDELYHAAKLSKFRCWLQKTMIFYGRSFKLGVKQRSPFMFRLLKRLRHIGKATSDTKGGGPAA